MENQDRKSKIKKVSETLESMYKIVSNRLVLIGIIIILIFLSIRQCERANGAEADSKRQHNNYLAMKDSVRVIKKEKDLLVVEKSAMEMKVSELTDEQKDLIKKIRSKIQREKRNSVCNNRNSDSLC